MNKICSICKIEKLEIDFTKSKGACKKCLCEKSKAYNITHCAERKEYNKQYNCTHKENQKKKDALRYKENKIHINSLHKIWAENNKEYLIQYSKEFRDR